MYDSDLNDLIVTIIIYFCRLTACVSANGSN